VRNAIITPLLEIFGWDVKNPEEVKEEVPIGNKRADYALKIDGDIQVIIEAKALDKDLTSEGEELSEYERQAINYAYNQGVNWAILTNGEEWRLYNAYWKGRKLAFDIEIGEFPKKEVLPKISLLRKDKVSSGDIEDYFEDRPKRPDVDEEVTQVLLDARADITQSVVELNEGYTEEEMRDGIQTIIDRLLFMKICEDRDIIDYGTLRTHKNLVNGDPDEQTTLSDHLELAFKRFRKVYDGGLFEHQIADELDVENGVLRELIETLYTYDFASIDVDILGRIYEDYLANVLTKLEEGGVEWITDNSERKEHGQFYTPQYIVDYIIDQVDMDTDSLVLDPACGSGAFLIKAFDNLKEQYAQEKEEDEVEVNNGIATLSNYLDKETEEDINRRILTDNLHGVDLNEEAVEITRINLWLRSIQKDTELNKLDHNIRTGNSLISGTDEELQDYFENPEEKNPFNWTDEFQEVFEENGGFDVVIGNPPYLKISKLDSEQENFLKEKYNCLKSESNTFAAFIERAEDLLSENGVLGFIVHKNLLNLKTHDRLREEILTEFSIEEIVDMGKGVFDEVTAETIIIILRYNGESKDVTIR
ncbi:MAG: Eco57I restriction-modification methylase domain-containing protein, partial [Candidatus Aenigmatarchaeota archaeon]